MDHDIEIFRAGQHIAIDGRSINFGEADLAGTADAYDPSLHEAPAVVGHPALDAPAYGWVTGVKHTGSRLTASFGQVDPQFAEQLKAGRYKKISAAFYEPDSPSNPTPGVYYLRHVGFLGAQPPSVKGLKQAQFADDDEYVAFSDGGAGVMRLLPASIARMIRGAVRQEISRAAPNLVSPLSQEEDMTSFAERERNLATAEAALLSRTTALETRETAIKTKETAFSERELTAFKVANTAVLDQLEKNGQSLPAWRPALLAFMERMQGGGTIAFGEGTDKLDVPMVEAFHEFLGGMPKVVHFAEIARTPIERAAQPVARFIAPKGLSVDSDLLIERDRILAYAQENKIDFVEAARRLEAQSAA